MTDPSPLSGPFIELQSVDSTNNYARSLIARGKASHGTAIFAQDQLKGKGQRGRHWVTEKDAGVSLTVVLEPRKAAVTELFSISACVATAATELLVGVGIDARIKWPNDLYFADRKLGGILIENVFSAGTEQGTWNWSVAGIGINVNQEWFPPELPNPVSVKQITGVAQDPRQLALELCRILERRLRMMQQQGFAAVLEEYNHLLYRKDEKVRLRKENRVFDATLCGVSAAGKLVVRHVLEEEFSFEEVEWLK
ncbi:MAG TPA: biotin--[acetyl-CoA-carboxylase] ligase [Chitinophagaceae bacterium]|nr:biotin--[acetyl-CoA-carboxylase] ligase [Chitinophagaceae bacterium]